MRPGEAPDGGNGRPPANCDAPIIMRRLNRPAHRLCRSTLPRNRCKFDRGHSHACVTYCPALLRSTRFSRSRSAVPTVIADPDEWPVLCSCGTRRNTGKRLLSKPTVRPSTHLACSGGSSRWDINRTASGPPARRARCLYGLRRYVRRGLHDVATLRCQTVTGKMRPGGRIDLFAPTG